MGSGCAGLVTIDVEPDNVWQDIRSRSLDNLKELPRFQALCREYGVHPTYLVTWSVANNDSGAKIVEKILAEGDCEVGIHPHLWETPPIGDIDLSGRACVGSDYAVDVLTEKITSLTSLMRQRFGIPLSHRAGRWGMDPRQVQILCELGIQTDTSVTPGLDLSATGAPDYRKAPLTPYFLGGESLSLPGKSHLLEVPCTVRPGRRLAGLERSRLGQAMARRLGLAPMQLRCSPTQTTRQLLQISAWGAKRLPHLNMMTHSSEFMAGGSPYWHTNADVASHFDVYRHIFAWWQQHGLTPKTLSEFRLSDLSARTPNPL